MTALPQWNLDLFPSLDSEEYTAMKKQVVTESKKLHEYADIFATTNAPRFLEAIKCYENIQWQLLHLYAYPHMSNDVDTTNTLAKTVLDQAKVLLMEVENELEWFSQSIKNMEDTMYNNYYSAPELQPYAHLLKQTRLYKPHTLSEREEQLLSQKDLYASSAWSDFHIEVASNITFDSITVDGKDVKMNQALLGFYARSKDPEVRRQAFFSGTKGFTEQSHILSYIYKQVIGSSEQDARSLRKFDSDLHRAAMGDEVTTDHIKDMVDVTRKHIPLYQEYYQWKAQQLGMKQLTPYDTKAPLFSENTKPVPFDQGKRMVLDCFGNFDEEMRSMAERFFDEQWIDAREGGNKYAGAYSWSMKHHPFILLNYQPDIQQVFTMIHELGHGVHSLLTNKEQPYLMRNHSKVTAESASQFSEMLLLDHILSTESDDQVKKYVLAHHVEDLLYCLFSTLTVTRFEMEAHEKAAQGGISNEDLKNIWQNATTDLRGDIISTLPDEAFMWSRVPHIFQTPFYYFTYPMSLLVVLSLYELYLEDKVGFIPKYKHFLSLGGSMTPEEMMKVSFGLSFGTQDFYARGFAVVEKLFRQLQEM